MVEETNVVLFYTPHGEYGFLSNFYLADFELDGKTWRSVEHYYQASKFSNPEIQESIRNASTPGKAMKMAHRLGTSPNWNEEKIQVMRKALYSKFFQNRVLAEKLLDTGTSILHEDSPKDREWGWRNNGKDLLGKLLMEIREELKKHFSLLN